MEEAILAALQSAPQLVIRRQREEIRRLRAELESLKRYVDEVRATASRNRDKEVSHREVFVGRIPET